MLYLTWTTALLYVLLGSIIGWFTRAIYDFEKTDENGAVKPSTRQNSPSL
jgi:hypothetical protein